MMLPRFLIMIALVLLSGRPLRAQGYETKFKATGFKPGDVYHTDEGVHVSLTGGGLEVEIPLGPALPGPIPLRPIVHYHGKFSQTLNPSWTYGQAFRDGMIGRDMTPAEADAYEKAYRRWSPPNLPLGEAHPGYLLFRAGSTALKSSFEPDLTINTPFGKTVSYYLGMPGAYTYDASRSKDASEIETLAKTMAPDWDRNPRSGSVPACGVIPGTTVSQSVGTALGVRLSGGTTLIFGPSDDQIFRRWSASISPITSELLRVPHEILQVDREFITLWRRNRNVYSHDWDPKDVNGTLADYRWNQSVYHPVWIRSRSGFQVDVTIYREAPKGHQACLSEGGILTGYRVSTHGGSTWFQVGHGPDEPASPSVTFGGMDVPSAEAGTFHGFTPVKPLGMDGGPLTYFQPGTTVGYESIYANPFHWELEYTSASLGFAGDSVTYGGLTTSFEWAGPQGQLSRLTTPSGKTYAFTHELYRGVGTNPRSMVSGISWLWNPATPSALDFYSMITRMDVSENRAGGAQTRSTTYHWKLPAVDQNPATTNLHWASPAQGVAQTLPSGETILHVFSSPVDGGDAALDLEGRTLLATRQAVTARYHYLSGDDGWRAFIEQGSDPSTTSWYSRERFEGWDLRSWESRIEAPKGSNPTYLSTNTEPRPTRTLKEERDGPVEVTEQDAWNADLGNYAVKRTYVMSAGTSPVPQFWAPGSMQGLNVPLHPGETSYQKRPGFREPSPAGALAHQVTKTAYSSDPSAALLDREQKVETKVLLAPPSGATGWTLRNRNIFDSGARAHIASQKDQLDLQGGSDALTLAFLQEPLGLFKVNQLLGVTLRSNVGGTPLSGLVGVAYTYDDTGRFLRSIRQTGAPWQEEEPLHDGLGRPLAHKDPNGLTTTFAWDELGRLTRIAPPGPETPTAISPENTLRRTTVTRGDQLLVYHYNGFGELIGEERTGPGGLLSHKTHGYDPGGRKTFETSWQSGPFTEFGAWAAPRSGGNGATTWTYDGRGRVIQQVNANGETTETAYPTPLMTQVTIHPDVNGMRSTTTKTFEKDVLGRLMTVTDAAGQVTSYAYDAGGRIRLVRQGVQTRTWTYDLFGRPDTLVQPESGSTKYDGYTVTGKPMVTTYGYGSGAPKTVFTSFDSLSRPLAIQSSDGSIDQAFAYDGTPAGGRTDFGMAMSQLNYSRDKDTELWYTFDGLSGRLGALDTRVGSPGQDGPLFHQAFTYAPDGLRQTASVDGRIQALSLDPASRLPLGVTHRSSTGYTLTVANFTQDATLWAPTRIDYGNGAFTTLAYREDQTSLMRLSHSLPGATGPALDWSYQYDGAGWLKGDGQDSYQYDPLGRLSQALVHRVNSPQLLAQRFTYDLTGNQISSVTTTDAGALPANLNNFSFSANAAELTQHNQLPAAQTGAQYDPQGNLTYLWKTSSPAGPFLRLAYDALGRISTLYDSATGLTEAYAYTPAGLRTRLDIYRGAALLKTSYKVYNDQRQLVSEYERLYPASPQAVAPKTAVSPAGATGASVAKPRPVRRKAAQKQALVLAEKALPGSAKPSQARPTIRFRNNDGTFPSATPTLIDNNGPAGAYITYPIGPVTVPLGGVVSFTGATDQGTDYTWNFGDGTEPVIGTFDSGSRVTPTITHAFSALSQPTFTVTLTVRNTAGGYTLSTATLSVTVVPPSLPVIKAFTANGLLDTATAYWGDAAVLAWEVAGATSLSIDQGVGPVGPVDTGNIKIANLQTTTTYTLTATNAAGSVSQGVRVRILPKVLSFSAESNPIDAGTSTALAWNVAGAGAITLQEGSEPPWDVTGTISHLAAPLSPTIYALVASNADGASPASTLQVNVVPVIAEFKASPSSITPGATTDLSWSISGADLAVDLEPGVGSVTGSTQAVQPLATTTYTLTATNAFTSVQKSVTVWVNGLPTITAQPQDQTVYAGQSATFTVAAAGPQPLAYQWTKNGLPIEGATTPSYTTPPTTLAEGGALLAVVVTNPYGNATSQAARLTVLADQDPPAVTAAETGSSGTILFTATATDNVRVAAVEFHVDGLRVGSVTTAPYSLAFDSRLLADGSHMLLAKALDPSGNAGTSEAVTFQVSNAVGAAPLILAQPQNQIVGTGQPATFAVAASGTAPLSYQWFVAFPGGSATNPIPGATGPSYTTPPTANSDDGAAYTVTIRNAYGSVTSDSATLTVTSSPQVGELVWKRDIVYVGTREVGEIDAEGLHITQVDHLGSPRLLSDKNGTLEDEQKYLPFGEYLDGQRRSHKGFTGHEQTDPSGLIYMQARFYAPMWGRFLSPDPARDQHFEETQSWNIYSYCQNDPTMRIDPTGMVSFKDVVSWVKNKWNQMIGSSNSKITENSNKQASVGVGNPSENLRRAEKLVQAGKPVGDGECPQLTKVAIADHHPTTGWHGTKSLLKTGAPAGTPVMTKGKDGHYPTGKNP